MQFSELQKLSDLDWVEVILVRMSNWDLPTHQTISKSEKVFVDGRTDGQTWVPIY